MDLEKFVDDYIDAWNRRDLDGLLGFFCDDGAIFDSFWMETSAGEDLPQYFETMIEEEPYWIQRVGDLIPIDEGVIFRYAGHEITDSGPGQLAFNGAEVMLLRDGKIANISDFYCDPRRVALEEVAKWATVHHGRLRTLGAGLAAVKASRYRDKLFTLMDGDKAFLNPNLTAMEVADRIGCSVDHLNQVVIAEMGASFYSFLDKQRAHYARQLLLRASDDPDYLYDVSSRAGFRTFDNFVRSFDRFFSTRPQDFYRENAD